MCPPISLPLRNARFLTATHIGYSPQARHKVNCPQGQERVPWGMTVTRNSLVWWPQTAPANLGIRYNLSSQVLDVISRLTSCAALLCRTLRRVADLCSSNLSDTANKSRHGSTLCSPTVEKILCRSLIVSALQISPCPLREKG